MIYVRERFPAQIQAGGRFSTAMRECIRKQPLRLQ